MILTRPACAADRDFIVSGWSASLRSSRDIPLVPMSTYATTFRPIIEGHLARAQVLVAHGEAGVLFGFLAFDPSTYVATIGRRHITLDGYVLYAYTAAPFRRRYGVQRRLFAAAGISPLQRFGYACRTRSSWELRSKIPLAEYDPYRARYEETSHGRSTDAEPEAARGLEGPGADQAQLGPLPRLRGLPGR